MANVSVSRWLTIPALIIFLQHSHSSLSMRMTYGLVYTHPSHQVPITVPAGESTILSTTVVAPLLPAKQAIANESKIVPQTQYTYGVMPNINDNPSNFQHRIGSTTNKYGIRSRYGQPATLSTPLIFHLPSAFASVKQSTNTPRSSSLPSSIVSLDHRHRRYEVVEHVVDVEKELGEKVNDDTVAEGSAHHGKKAKAGKKGSKHSHKHYAKHGKKQESGHKGHHFKDYKNKKKGAHESSGHKSHKHASKKKSHKSQGKKGGEHRKKGHKMKKKKFKKHGAKKKYHKKKGFKDKYKVDKEDKIHKFWNNHHETGEFYEFGKKDKYHHETKKGEKEGKHKKAEKKSGKKKKEGLKKSKKGEKKDHGYKAHKNKKKFYHTEHEYSKKKKNNKKEQHKVKKKASKKGGHKKKKKKH